MTRAQHGYLVGVCDTAMVSVFVWQAAITDGWSRLGFASLALVRVLLSAVECRGRL